MKLITPKKVICVSIAVEKYAHACRGLDNLNYALADVSRFTEIAKRRFSVVEANLISWVNEKALKSTLEQELPYIISGLEENDLFLFFYAGHGFSLDGENYLTTHDTHPSNLSGTSVNFKKIVEEPLRKSHCRHVLSFIDACAVTLPSSQLGRDVVAKMNQLEFREFVQGKPFAAFFFSCSAGQKSFESPSLGHGVWSSHLLNALDGQEEAAMSRDSILTGQSLNDFLAFQVPKYIRANMTIKGTQSPWSTIGSSGDFGILEFQQAVSAPLQYDLDYDGAYFQSIEAISFDKLPGFAKRVHFVPTSHDMRSVAFAEQHLLDDFRAETKEIYDRCKDRLSLKRREIERTDTTVDTEWFRFEIDVRQELSDPGIIEIMRRVSLRKAFHDIPTEVDGVFANSPDEVVIPFRYCPSFDAVVDGFEELGDRLEGRVSEDEDIGEASFIFEGVVLTINVNLGLLTFRKNGTRGCKSLIKAAESAFTQLSGAPVKLLLK